MVYNFSIEEIKNNLKNFSMTEDFYSIFLYYKGLKEYIETNNFKKNSLQEYKIYNSYLAKLKFLSLNFFDDFDEICDLLKNYFELIYEIDNFNLWEKLKINLIAVFNLEERSKIKETIKNVLLDCDRNILDINKYREFKNFPLSVKDWIKDYHINLGIKKVDNLKRVQYLTNGENIKKLTIEDKEKIKILFDLYEKLRLPSTSREGFEEEIPMTINGKFIIFRNGDAEEIPENLFKIIKSIKINKDNFSEDINNSNQKNLNLLKKELLNYPPDSLERKAIEEEIRKLEGGK